MADMDLFGYMGSKKREKEAPLAARMRPETLEEIVGQKHIIGEGTLLNRAIRADKLGSIILFGPPGTGKTTIAKVIAHTTKSSFCQINATSAGKKDMEEVVHQAKDSLNMYGRKTILFIDEIHRFNKSQQDYLLPFVEDGTLVLIGATTENPYFEVNSALISRSVIFELKPLTAEEIKTLIKRAVYDPVKGLGSFHVEIDDDALEFLADIAGGDARIALNAVELAALTTDPEIKPAESAAAKPAAEFGEASEEEKSQTAQPCIRITLEVAENCVQKRAIRYERSGDNHYDTISAFIKSMRGSDPDAAVYYLSRMLYGGEDVKFIARRIMICASEDVGNADPQALQVAVAAAQAVERVGMPESRIILAHAAIYVACAPKSNAIVCAIDDADRHVREHSVKTVPPHLQDAHYGGHDKLGRGIGYKYAHDFPEHYVKQQYLPDEAEGTVFYKPGEIGYEKEIKERLERLRKRHGGS